MQQAIHALKFDRNQRLGRELGRRLGRACWLQAELADIDLLVPVPLHPARQRERGYNQSLCIAAGLAEAIGKPVRPGLVRRRRATRQQARLDAAERASNLADAFETVGDVPSGIRLGLVDDVVTTGATLASCCKVLERRGVSVLGVALASPYPRRLDVISSRR
jgi:ComF family protein